MDINKTYSEINSHLLAALHVIDAAKEVLRAEYDQFLLENRMTPENHAEHMRRDSEHSVSMGNLAKIEGAIHMSTAKIDYLKNSDCDD